MQTSRSNNLMSNDKTKKIFQKYNIKEENHSQPGLT